MTVDLQHLWREMPVPFRPPRSARTLAMDRSLLNEKIYARSAEVRKARARTRTCECCGQAVADPDNQITMRDLFERSDRLRAEERTRTLLSRINRLCELSTLDVMDLSE